MTLSRNRRQFLRGAGGFALALPFLESLSPREARAQEVVTPRFVGMMTLHGGVWGANMFPSDAMAPETRQLFPGHMARFGQLTPEVSGGQASLSPVLTASSSLLTPTMASKMSGVVRFRCLTVRNQRLWYPLRQPMKSLQFAHSLNRP